MAVPEAQIAEAEVLVSDVFSLELIADGMLLEQGSEMGLFVKAFDYRGDEFDAD